MNFFFFGCFILTVEGNVLAITHNAKQKPITKKRFEILLNETMNKIPNKENVETIFFAIQESDGGKWSNPKTIDSIGKSYFLQGAKCVSQNVLMNTYAGAVINVLMNTYARASNRRTCLYVYTDSLCKQKNCTSNSDTRVNIKKGINKGCVGMEFKGYAVYGCHLTPHLKDAKLLNRIQQFEQVLKDAVATKSSDSIIMGDMNHRAEENNHYESETHLLVASDYGFKELVAQGKAIPPFDPTYKVKATDNGLQYQIDKKHPPSFCDHIYYKGEKKILQYDSLPETVSRLKTDHIPVFALIGRRNRQYWL